ncbi:MAG: hypothetical protein IH616_05320 [Gemmatimonadales bacterium]|nr:hypothetical protein [Gemmatimonadales bacterium]
MSARAPQQDARDLAAELLCSGEFGSPLARDIGVVETPVPVMTPEEQPHSWFVGVSVGDALVGYFQIGLALTLLRYSAFQRDPGSTAGCPSRAEWLDPDVILTRARTVLVGEPVGQPQLTYDRAPSRILWLVRMRDGEGRVWAVHVAGALAYLAEPGRR